jgi:hypothetical protein
LIVVIRSKDVSTFLSQPALTTIFALMTFAILSVDVSSFLSSATFLEILLARLLSVTKPTETAHSEKLLVPFLSQPPKSSEEPLELLL